MAPHYETPNFECVECLNKIPWQRTIKIYCSEFCQEKTDYIRYHRKTIRNGKIQDPDVQTDVRIRRAHVLSGEYLRSKRRISKKSLLFIISRDSGRCAFCGNLGTGIDHISGPSNEVPNLRLICRPCHDEKTLSGLNTVSILDPEFAELQPLVFDLDDNIYSKKPNRECHNELLWEHRSKEIREERKLEFHRSIHPMLRKYINSNSPSNTKIAEFLNENAVPTWSGKGKWNNKSASEVRKLIEQ